MRRRIALTILATVWAMLLAAGAGAYWATRAVLLSDLDARLLARAAAVPGGAGAAADEDGGRYVVRSAADRRTLSRPAAAPAPTLAEAKLISATFATLADGHRVRSLTIRARGPAAAGGAAGDEVVITYSGSAEAFHRVLGRLLWTLSAGGAAAGLAAAGIAYYVSSIALRPLRDVARVVGSIGERRLDRRIAVADLPPELGPVGRRLNRMLGKIEQAFARRRQFLADAAHELRTPVAALVTGLEVTLARPRTADAYRARLDEALADATDLRVLVERLMEQVRGEAFGGGEPEREVDLAALLADAVGSVGPLARARSVAVRTSCPPGLRARVRPAQLTSVVTNLLSNAVDYNRPDGTVDLRAWAAGQDLRLTVVDTGVGIPPDQQTAMFEPFVRGDAARTGAGGHSGLGLFLVRTHLAAMNVRWVLRSEVGVGTQFDMTFTGRVVTTMPGPPAPPPSPSRTGNLPSIEASEAARLS
jgi:signal transduction histidine kinase